MALDCAASNRRIERPPLANVDWSERPVTVMGLGRHGGGAAAVRFLARHGARITISDVADRSELSDSLDQLRDVPLAALKLGGHDPADFRTDTVVVNPAVRPEHACLAVARACGARLVSETELFLAHCPAHVIGVTGSNGKSTTCAMLHAILSAAGRSTWLGGNIGRSLLGDVERMRRDDWVVLELSSFQLAHLSGKARLPEMAAITNCTPNHIDWHGTWDGYAAAKQRLIRAPNFPSGTCDTPASRNAVSPPPCVILNRLDAEVVSWSGLAARPPVFNWPLEELSPLRVAGQHNRENAACAAAAAEAAGIERATIVAALARFQGLPHRLELVGEVAGRRFYNDSKSTSPQATMAALAAVEEPVWLLAGGLSKGASFQELAAQIVARARGAAVFGAASKTMHRELHCVQRSFDAVACDSLGDAFDWCWMHSQPGDAILLSPACASHDQFRDFGQRGEAFRALVDHLDRMEAGQLVR